MESWQSRLAQGDPHAAWDLFAERYRRLMLATIRRLVADHDDVMDVFATVCQSLAADDCARLRRYSAQSASGASVATWLVVVVRNRTIDWLRQSEGRTRTRIPEQLTPLRRQIYHAICVDGASRVEAYEMIRTRASSSLTFTAFLAEVRETFRDASCPDDTLRQPVRDAARLDEIAAPHIDTTESAESARRIATALATQPPDVRLAVQMFVVDGAPAADVARVVGWPNAKAVYNRVYRALEALRVELERGGIRKGDL